MIRVLLARKHDPPSVPSPRTLQRWFAKHALPAAPPGQRPRAVTRERATCPHEGWQMDASELIPLRDGTRISWLRLADEFSGAVLQTSVFSQAHFHQVAVAAVQKQLRRAFSGWGRPGRFRVDNGTPWGSSGDFPTDLALWLIGADIEVIWIPPCRPDKNGVVERSQGVGKRWAEPSACATPTEL